MSGNHKSFTNILYFLGLVCLPYTIGLITIGIGMTFLDIFGWLLSDKKFNIEMLCKFLYSDFYHYKNVILISIIGGVVFMGIISAKISSIDLKELEKDLKEHNKISND